MNGRQPIGTLFHHPYSRRSLVHGAVAVGLGSAASASLANTTLGQAATPAQATPAAEGTRSITRDDYLVALRRHYGLEAPATSGGHVISVLVREPASMNPFVGSDVFSARVLENVFSSLARPSLIDGTWVPDLADYWDVSGDGLVYTFHLNRNATWHDGVPVTADDCVFTLDAVLDERSLSGIRSIVLREVASYRAVDEHTFELVGKQPIATLLDNSVGGLAIVPRHIWEAIPLDDWGSAPGSTGDDPSQVIGSGPYRFGEWSSEGHVSIVRNDNYWVPEMIPALDEASWLVLPETSAAVQALVAGEVDYCFVPPVEVESLRESNPELTLLAYDSSSWLCYAANGDPDHLPFFVDPRVRQAMLYALDRDAMVATMLGGYGARADGIYPPPSPFWAPERVTTIYGHDPDRARALFDAAGWREGTNGVRVKDGVQFRVEMIFVELETLRRQVVTYLQQAWRDVGIEVQPVALEFAILGERLDTGDYAIALAGLGVSGEQGDLYRCDRLPPNGGNIQRICNPEFDRLNDASLVELDPVKRRELVIEQGNVVNDAATLGLLFFRQATVGARSRLRNFFANDYAQAGALPWIWLAEGE